MKKVGIFKSMRKLSEIGRERKGVAAVEFALVVPFIVIMFLASVDAVFALTAKRKVAVATYSIADVSSRALNLNDDDLSAIADLGRLILTPFNASQSRILITGAEVLSNGNQAVVRWSHLSEASNGATGGAANETADDGTSLPTDGGSSSTVTEMNAGDTINLNANLSPGTFLVQSVIELPYRSFFEFLETRYNDGNLFTMRDRAYSQSRSGTEITNLDL